jgi:hypothetical protein
VLSCGDSLKDLHVCRPFEAEDSNDAQMFPICTENIDDIVRARYLKIEFHASFDFYGRITIYKLQVFATFISPHMYCDYHKYKQQDEYINHELITCAFPSFRYLVKMHHSRFIFLICKILPRSSYSY